MTRKMIAALSLALAVAGCGYSQSERTSGGAAAGAATGAGVGALGGPVGVLAGAAIGAGAGAVTGATTSPQDVNLGRPPWTNPEARVPGVDEGPRAGRRAGRSSDSVRRAQQNLAASGFDPGPADGVWGAQSARAAQDFQRSHNLAVTGRLDRQTMNALRTGGTTRAAPATTTGTGTTGTGTTGAGTTGTGTTGMGTSGTGTSGTGTSGTGAPAAGPTTGPTSGTGGASTTGTPSGSGTTGTTGSAPTR
jgi:hypothetical protein